MAEIRHLENRHDVIFSAEGSPIWIKCYYLVVHPHHDHLVTTFELSDILTNTLNNVF